MSEFRHSSEGGTVSGGSIFDLPVSPGARAIRIALILLLDAALAGAGIFMIVSYVNSGSEELAEVSAAPDAEVHPAVALEPSPVLSDAAPSHNNGSTSGRTKASKSDVKKSPTPATPSTKEPAGTKPVKETPTPAKPTPSTPTPTTPSPAKPDPTPSGGEPPSPPPAPDAGAVSAPVDAGPSSVDPPNLVDAASPPEEPPVAAGEPSPDDVRRIAGSVRSVVRRNQNSLDNCYRQAAKVGNLQDELQGRIVIRLAIEPTGTTSNVRVVQNTTGSPDLGACLVRLVRGFQVSAHEFEPIEFEWPFVFSPEGA